jgi:hypothetical protein
MWELTPLESLGTFCGSLLHVGLGMQLYVYVKMGQAHLLKHLKNKHV